MSDASIADNLRRLREEIDDAARRAGRNDVVTLVAVSKTMPAERIREAYAAGQRVFGENRVQEGVAKMEKLAADMPDARWHLIGHLQSNKARRAAEEFSMIESVDSLALARKLDTAAESGGRRLPVLLEVNVAGEVSKSGFSPEVLDREIAELARLPHLDLRGLMTVAPLTDSRETLRAVFRRLREMRDRIRSELDESGFSELSMGMSGDFELAIQEGATMVRLGRAIFGERPQ